MSRVRSETEDIFVDREEPLSILNEALKEVVQTGNGRAVFIDGEPGVGKTALAARLVGSIEQNSAIVVRATGREYGTGPYSALGEMLEGLLKTTTSRERGKQVASTLANLAVLMPSIGPYVSIGVNLAKSVAGLSSTDVGQISDSLYVRNVFLTLLEKVSRKRPIIAFFDDAQRFDSSSLEALGYLVDNISKIRVLVVVCFREKNVAFERERGKAAIIEETMKRTGSTVLHLEPLRAGFSAQLVKQMSEGTIEGRNVSELVERTGGNPLYIVKTINEMRGSVGVPKALPAELRRYVADQLLQIQKENGDARLMLDYAAMLGKRFLIEDVAHISGLQALKVKHILEQLASDYGIVRETESADACEFDHDTTREVILGSQGSLARDQHLEVAEYYDRTGRTDVDPQLTAYHYEMAGNYYAAFSLYRKAAERSAKNLSFDSAVHYLQSCVSLIESGKVTTEPSSEASLLLELATTEFSSGLFAKAFTDSLSAIEMSAPDTDQFAESHLLAGKCCRYIGTIEASERGREHLEVAARVFEKTQNQHMRGTTYSILSTFSDHFGNHEQAVEYYGESQKAFNLARDLTGLAELQRKSGMIRDSRRAIDIITGAISVFTKSGSMIELARCYNNLGAEHLYLGQFEPAESNLSQALEIYRKIDSYEIDAPLNNLGIAYTRTKRLESAYDVLSEAESKATEDFDRICILTNIAMIHSLRSDFTGGFEVLSRLIPLVERSGEPLIQDYFAFNLSTVLLAMGRYREALEWVEKYPPNEWKGDTALVRAKRLRLRGTILSRLGRETEGMKDLETSNKIFLTNRPQKWFYELSYYPCDIHFLD